MVWSVSWPTVMWLAGGYPCCSTMACDGRYPLNTSATLVSAMRESWMQKQMTTPRTRQQTKNSKMRSPFIDPVGL